MVNMPNLSKLQKRKMTAFFLSCALMTGCSTMQARTQDVLITTDPAGIRATIDNKSCITPCKLTMVDRTAEYVTFEQGAYRHQYLLDQLYISGAITRVEFIGLKIIVPADLITGAAYEILPIDIKFSGSAENPLKTASPIGGTSGLREVPVEPDLEKESITSTKQAKRPFALAIGVSRNFYAYDTRTVTGVLRLEKMFDTYASFYLDVGYADSRSTYGEYSDAAHGLGGELGINVYLSGRGFEGPYFGAGMGSFELKGNWKDDVGTPFETTGRGNARVVDFNFHIGHKWSPAVLQGFFIDPSIALDVMSTKCEPYPFGPAGASLKAGLAIGKRW